MKIEYPKYKDLNKITKDDFCLLAYINEDKITSLFNAMGFNYEWFKKSGSIEDTILELIDECLKSLRTGKKSTYTETGGIRVELDVVDLDDDGLEEIQPSILLTIWNW